VLSRQVAIIGLGYVGLPVAVAFGRAYDTLGFDIDRDRVTALRRGEDWTHEISSGELAETKVKFISDVEEMRSATVFIVCVPTPIHQDRRPDLRPLQSASESVGKVLKKGDVVVYESTVYPGLTEDYCGPILARASGLKQGLDFKLGYSPERINPGDKEHTFQTIKKVVAGEDLATGQLLADLYGSVVQAGVHLAPSIKVAEAAKVLENTQRDLNIALMNELAIICDHMNIRTRDVLDAAETKWNFLKFSPGLVGGHCIGVDPYYLTSKAQELGYHPEVILAGRRINDSMGATIARRLVRFLGEGERPLRDCRVGILGITFKENVPDIRNSRVPDILVELKQYGISSLIHDPLADAASVEHEYGLSLSTLESLAGCDALVLAVPHAAYLKNLPAILSAIGKGGSFIDVKSAVPPISIPGKIRYWSL